MYRLVFETGQRKGQVFDADNTPIVDIGRDPSCKLCLEESGVSRRHSIIQQMEDGIFISDLSSTNGTFVNSHKITKETRLRSGDRVEIGAVKFVFQLAPPSKPGQPRRRGKLFFFALICLAIIVIIELVALAIAWQARTVKPAPPPAATATSTAAPQGQPVEPPAPPPSPEELLAASRKEMESKLSRAEELAKEISDARTQSDAGVDALAEQLKALRGDIADLRQRIEDIASKQPAPAEPPAAPAAETPSTPATDPIVLRVEQMVNDADRAKMMGQFDQAIRILQGATVLAPEHVAAYSMLAEVYELKGMKEAAIATWQKIVAMGPSAGKAFEEATARLAEMARREAASKLPEMKPVPKPPQPTGIPGVTPVKVDLPRQLRIVELHKIDPGPDPNVDERFSARFLVRAQTGEKFVATEDVKIEVKFYDRLETGEVIETNAETTKSITIPTLWESFDRKTFTAQYTAAKGLRKKETEDTGKKRRSYGYIVRVFYRGKLQDEKSDPEKLVTFFPHVAAEQP